MYISQLTANITRFRIGEIMVFNTGSALWTPSCWRLSPERKGPMDTRLQDVRRVIDIPSHAVSGAQAAPGGVEVYDLAIDGRNRRYYRSRRPRRAQLSRCTGEWSVYSQNIPDI